MACQCESLTVKCGHILKGSFPFVSFEHHPDMALKRILLTILLLLSFSAVHSAAENESFAQGTRRITVDRVVAIVGDEVITNTDLQRSLLPLLKQLSTRYAGGEFRQKALEAQETVLQQLIDNKLILHTARQLRGEEEYQINEKDVLAYMDRIISQFPSRDVFEESLKRENLSFEDFKKDSIDQILVKKLVGKEVSSRVLVTNADIRQYYEDRPGDFQTPPKIRFAQIWLKTAADTAADKQQLMETLLQQLEEGADFHTLAKQHSEGPHAADGGVWETTERGKFTPELDDAIWSLEPGQLSPIIDTKASLHLVLVERIHKARQIPMEDKWDEIENQLYYERAEKVRKDWVAKLRENAYIQVFGEAIEN